MSTSCMIAGRIAEKPMIRSVSGGFDECWMTVESDKPFSTADNVRHKDRFRIRLWRGIAEECAAACEKGSIVIVKGRLESETEDNQDVTTIIAEAVSLIS